MTRIILARACLGREDPVKNVLSLLDQRRREEREKTAC